MMTMKPSTEAKSQTHNELTLPQNWKGSSGTLDAEINVSSDQCSELSTVLSFKPTIRGNVALSALPTARILPSSFLPVRFIQLHFLYSPS